MYKRQLLFCSFQILQNFSLCPVHPAIAGGDTANFFLQLWEMCIRDSAYTNHTILAEALEKWPRAYLDAVVPQLMPIIEKLDTLARTRTEDEGLAIIGA